MMLKIFLDFMYFVMSIWCPSPAQKLKSGPGGDGDFFGTALFFQMKLVFRFASVRVHGKFKQA